MSVVKYQHQSVLGQDDGAVEVPLYAERTVAVKEILADIRRRLQGAEYRCEEHVRLSLVARVLQQLGWDVWNPREAQTEFVVVPNEDNTKVDFALFVRPGIPAVFIEVKAVGKIANLEQIERQLRDYNRNITALFCVITDGRVWRLYYSQTGGEFSKKCFKVLDLVTDNLDDIEHSLMTFLSKQEILGGKAEEEAKGILRLTLRQRAMEEGFRPAQNRTQLPPFPSFPQALVDLLALEGINLTREEAEAFIEKMAKKKEADAGTPDHELRRSQDAKSLIPNCRHATMDTPFGRIAEEVLAKAGSFVIFREKRKQVAFLPETWAGVIPENGTFNSKLKKHVSVLCYIEIGVSKSISRKNQISLKFVVRPMNDAKLRADCLEALERGGFPSKHTEVWSQFFHDKQDILDPNNKEEVQEAMQKLLADAKDKFSRAEAVLRRVFQ